jgi:hypothetical protein
MTALAGHGRCILVEAVARDGASLTPRSVDR